LYIKIHDATIAASAAVSMIYYCSHFVRVTRWR